MNPLNLKEDYTDARAKHLGLIQDVVSRQSGSASSTKRLTMVVVGAAAALAARGNGDVGALPLLAIILVAILWMIDARYHQQECWFRDLYDRVTKEPQEQRPTFTITPPHDIRAGRKFQDSLWSWSTASYYVALGAFLVLTWSTVS